MGFLNTKEVSKILGVEECTLILWRHKGRGPSYYKVGMSVKYDKKDIDAYLKRGRVKPPKR